MWTYVSAKLSNWLQTVLYLNARQQSMQETAFWLCAAMFALPFSGRYHKKG